MTHEEFESLAALSALDATTADEERMLDEHARSCEACRRLRAENVEAVALLARNLDPVAPPAELRARITGSVSSTARERRTISSHVWWLATAATFFLALWGWREMGITAAHETVRSQQAEIERLNIANRNLELQREKLSTEMSALAAAGTRTIALSGQQVAPSASARVFMEPERRRAVVFFSNLPENASDKSYQLWILRADQPKPQSAGVFDVNKGTAAITIENLPLATEIKGLAVTLERHGGSEQPTNTNFYVLGNT